MQITPSAPLLRTAIPAASPLGARTAEPGIAGGDDRLWREFDRRIAANRAGNQRKIAVGFSGAEVLSLRDAFRLVGSDLTASVADIGLLRRNPEFLASFDVVMVNHDAFADTETAIDEYQSFRQRHPEVIVVIVSRKVAHDDLTSTRRPICDATLRAPVTPERLSRGVKAATLNASER